MTFYGVEGPLAEFSEPTYYRRHIALTFEAPPKNKKGGFSILSTGVCRQKARIMGFHKKCDGKPAAVSPASCKKVGGAMASRRRSRRRCCRKAEIAVRLDS